jgi:hypothetical protein
MFRTGTEYIPDFFVAEHYGLRNTSSWESKELACDPQLLFVTPNPDLMEIQNVMWKNRFCFIKLKTH